MLQKNLKDVFSSSRWQERYGRLHGPHNVISGDIKDPSAFCRHTLKHTNSTTMLSFTLLFTVLLLPHHVKLKCHVCLLFFDMQLLDVHDGLQRGGAFAKSPPIIVSLESIYRPSSSMFTQYELAPNRSGGRTRAFEHDVLLIKALVFGVETEWTALIIYFLFKRECIIYV